MSTFVPSKYQQAIFDWVTGDRKALVVEALAGSGKTTTGVEALKLIPDQQEVLFIAFNKHIQMHVAGLLEGKKNVEARTYNSLGDEAIRNKYPYAKLNNYKNWDAYKELFPEQKHRYSSVSALIGLVKANLCPLEFNPIMEIVDRHYIDTFGHDFDVVSSVIRIIEVTTKDMTRYTFDDQCWMPVALKFPVRQYDFIFIDEAQDTSKVQLQLALKCLKKDGRIVAVGDRYQSIYAFRGADSEAIPNIIRGMKADTLPLSISYRCPVSHVEQCNNLFPEIPIEHAPNAKIGEIKEHIDLDQFIEEVQPGNMVLCRTNAPLVAPAFTLIRKGKKVLIKGRDIGNNLVAMIKKSGTKESDSLEDMYYKMNEYCAKEIGKLLLKRNSEMQIQTLEDKQDTIYAIAKEVKSVTTLMAKINEIFEDDKVPDIIFSSIHKAKGLEADVVYVLNRFSLMPHPKARSATDVAQERNIMYVAFTRSKKDLIYVDLPQIRK